jgi:ribosomal protein L39E
MSNTRIKMPQYSIVQIMNAQHASLQVDNAMPAGKTNTECPAWKSSGDDAMPAGKTNTECPAWKSEVLR